MSSTIAVLNIPKYHADEMLGRVHSIESFGTVDGPGTRFVVFLQGCLFRCKYCHNRDTWDLDGGELYSVTEMVEQILPYAKFMDASGGGVTVTGGEPVLQAAFVGSCLRNCTSTIFTPASTPMAMSAFTALKTS